jgi:hypothetical protein
VQAEPVADQQRRQHQAFQHLAGGEHPADGDQVPHVLELDEPGDQRQREADHPAQVRHEGDQPGGEADQQALVETDHGQRNGVEGALRQHHQQLAMQKAAEHAVGLGRELAHRRPPARRQQRVDLRQQLRPVAQQVERHHRHRDRVHQQAE